MVWFIYNVLFAVGYVILLPRYLVRMWRRGGYRRGFLQRVGWYDRRTLERLSERRRIWIHAVSVGEVYVALRVMGDLRARARDVSFVLTTTTSTGHRVAGESLSAPDVLLYFPADFPVVVRRVLSKLRPRALLLTECELWPNLIRRAALRGIPVVLVNGRLSDSSFRGYRFLRMVFSPLLSSFSLLLVQGETERQRFQELGAEPGCIHVVGSMKYDAAQRGSRRSDEVREALGHCGITESSTVLLGGSTWAGEERVLLALFRRLRPDYPDLRLMLVPRHVERCPEIRLLIQREGLSPMLRSEAGPGRDGPPDVVLVDTTGELADIYGLGTVVFVGKSLTAHGGQNIIDPALAGKPVIVGPHMENFPLVLSDLLDAEAVVQVRDEQGLESEVRSFLSDRERRETWGRRAAATVEAKRGAVATSAGLICGVLTRAGHE